MNCSRRGAESLKAWPSPPLVSKVAIHVLRVLWRNLALLTLICTSERPPSLCWPCHCVPDCVSLCVRSFAHLCVRFCLGYQFSARLCSQPCCVWYWRLKKEKETIESPTKASFFWCHLCLCCWSWEFVSIRFPLREHKKGLNNCLLLQCSRIMPKISMVRHLPRSAEGLLLLKCI